jgi:acyl-coenzyme A synthetase/AMP-(fatty) acid ligase
MNAKLPLINRLPDDIVAIEPNGPLTAAELSYQVRVLARELPSHRYVINLCADPIDFMFGFCAAMAAGQCTLMPPNRLESTIAELAADYPDCYVMGGEPEAFDVKEARVAVVSAPRGEMDPLRLDPGQLSAIAFTSGSTGKPQANQKFWSTLRTGAIANSEMILGALSETAHLVTTVPPQHMWGLETSVLLPLFASAAISGRTPFYPRDVEEALKRLPEPRVLVSTPVHLAAMIRSGLRFPHVRRVLCATAPLSRELAADVERAFDAELLEVYGCSESGILASRPILDDETWTLADIFDLRIEGDRAIVTGDHLPAEVTLQDHIEQVGERRFRWRGRKEDLVIMAGKRGSLSDITLRLLSVPGVEDAVVFFPANNPDRPAALIVAPGLDKLAIRRALADRLEAIFIPRPLVFVDRLPRGETGKLGSAAVQALYERSRRRLS